MHAVRQQFVALLDTGGMAPGLIVTGIKGMPQRRINDCKIAVFRMTHRTILCIVRRFPVLRIKPCAQR